MRSRTFSIAGTAALLGLVLAVGSAVAQTSVTLTAEVPFEFHAGKAALPAGEYTLQRGLASNALLIARSDRTAHAVVLTNGAEKNTAPGESKLVFHKYGDRYFLAQVWTAGMTRGYDLPVTKTERELTRIARHQIVTVLAKR
jgi:hypothetical protein